MQNQLTQIRSENTSTGDLRTVLAYVYTLCGFEKMPDKLQDTVLINFINKNFSDLTLEDIKLAFELGISGETGVNMKHYHNFNAIYFADVINAYKTYKRSRKDLTPKLIESPVMDDKKKKESHSKWLDSCVFPYIEKFNKGEITEVPDFGNTLYNYLDKRFINFSKDRKDQIKEKARTELLSELRVEKMGKPGDRNMIGQSITDILMGGQDTEGLVRTRAKKLALNTFMTECKEMDRNIIKEIKEYECL